MFQALRWRIKCLQRTHVQRYFDFFDCFAPIAPSRRANNTLVSSNGKVEFLFVVDTSGSMRSKDVEGSDDRRIDVVVRACEEFIEKQSTTMPIDRYSLIHFNDSAERAFTKVDASKARSWFCQNEHILVPGFGTNYFAAMEKVSIHSSKSHLRVLFLSDGRPNEWSAKTLDRFQTVWLPRLANQSRSLEIHCIGFGPSASEFEVMQQMAQLGYGTTQFANLDVSALRRCFTSISSKITATRTSSSNSSSKFLSREVCLAPPPRNGSAHHTIHLKCERFKYLWNPIAANVCGEAHVFLTVSRHIRPYAQGNMRLVYDMREEGTTKRMVAKETKFRQVLKNEEKCFAKSSACAAYFAGIFREQTGYDVHILPCYVYCVKDKIRHRRGGFMNWFCGEEYVPGVFTKWISNSGYVSDSPQTDILASFAHFTYHHSSGKLMVTDLQGVFSENQYTLTDPQVLSYDQSFGRADLGRNGMQKFLDTHECGPVCQALGISRNTYGCAFSLYTPGPSLPKRNTVVGERVEAHALFTPAMFFVGECSLSFSRAAAQLYTEKCAHAPIKDWYLAELRWPQCGETKEELDRNMLYLKSTYGKAVCILYPQPVDALALPLLDLSGLTFDCFMWSMPYPDGFFPLRTAVDSAALKAEMRRLVHGFVKAAAPYLPSSTNARVSVVLVAKQHLDWGLREPVQTEKCGTLYPEVHVFDLQKLLDRGYVPRFGDDRDTQGRAATYHRRSEAVVVSWRPPASPMYLRGISDTKLRLRNDS